MTLSNSQRGDRLCRRIEWTDLDRDYLERLILMARDEDLAGAGLRTAPERTGDATTAALIGEGTGTAQIVAREELWVCGLPLVPLILNVYGKPSGSETRVEFQVEDGDRVGAGTVLAQLRSDLATLLTAERVLLNFLQHLSGVATATAAYVEALGSSPTRLLDTRKTTPAFRVLEKYAVARGGGWNHRMGLFDRIMIKDNHLAAGDAAKGARLADYVRRAAGNGPGIPVEVEVDALDQLPPVLEAGPDVILLDNFSPDQLKEAVARIGNLAATEASGGITVENLSELGRLGLTFISCGALTHQSRWKDIALDWGG